MTTSHTLRAFREEFMKIASEKQAFPAMGALASGAMNFVKANPMRAALGAAGAGIGALGARKSGAGAVGTAVSGLVGGAGMMM